MELRMYCAYNQTRECFLGLEVAAGDFSCGMLSKQGALAIKPNEGLWLTPFRGIPDSGVTSPVDLIYLDKDCCVIDLIESFPGVRSMSSNPATETVLVLPMHSILSSETRVGDQLVLCVPEEMQRQLERLSAEETEAGAAPLAVLIMQKPLEARAERLAAPQTACQDDGITSRSPVQTAGADSEKGRFGLLRKWVRQWSSPELREAPRQSAPSLEAFYWNGLPPFPHDVRDISAKGLYLVTDDRWYPGTLVLMTLQDKQGPPDGTEHAISVRVRAVRSGDDGVGLQFVVTPGAASRNEVPAMADGDRIEEFLQRMGYRE